MDKHSEMSLSLPNIFFTAKHFVFLDLAKIFHFRMDTGCVLKDSLDMNRRKFHTEDNSALPSKHSNKREEK